MGKCLTKQDGIDFGGVEVDGVAITQMEPHRFIGKLCCWAVVKNQAGTVKDGGGHMSAHIRASYVLGRWGRTVLRCQRLDLEACPNPGRDFIAPF